MDGLSKKHSKSDPHCWAREGSTQFAQQFLTAVTDPTLVCCVVWSHYIFIIGGIIKIIKYILHYDDLIPSGAGLSKSCVIVSFSNTVVSSLVA